MTFLSDANRWFAAGSLMALTLMALASATPTPRAYNSPDVTAQTPRTAKPCDPQACLSAAPDRARVGFGSGGARARDPGFTRDPSVRWATTEASR